MSEDLASTFLSLMLGVILGHAVLELWCWLKRLGKWLKRLYWDWQWHLDGQRITEEELAKRLGVSVEDLAELARSFAEAARIAGIPAERLVAGLREWARQS